MIDEHAPDPSEQPYTVSAEDIEAASIRGMEILEGLRATVPEVQRKQNLVEFFGKVATMQSGAQT